jgi:hypothetical protein
VQPVTVAKSTTDDGRQQDVSFSPIFVSEKSDFFEYPVLLPIYLCESRGELNKTRKLHRIPAENVTQVRVYFLTIGYITVLIIG